MGFPTLQEILINIKGNDKEKVILSLKYIGDKLRGHCWENGEYYLDKTITLHSLAIQLINLFLTSDDYDIKEEVLGNLIEINCFYEIEDFYELYYQILEPLDKLNYLEINDISLNELYYSLELVSTILIKEFLQKYETPLKKLLNTKYNEQAVEALDELNHLRKLENLKNLSTDELNFIINNEKNYSFAMVNKAKELLIIKRKE